MEPPGARGASRTSRRGRRPSFSDIARTNRPLFRAYLLKEQRREVFALPFKAAISLLDDWLKWARRCRIGPFVELARAVTDDREAIEKALRHRLTNARVEAVNTRIRLLTRIAFGFHSSQPLSAMRSMLLRYNIVTERETADALLRPTLISRRSRRRPKAKRDS